jgi:putative glutamine amidotransferase
VTILVAVPGRLAERAAGVRTPAVAAGRRYLEALRRAGGDGAVLLPAPSPDWPALLARFDGLLLLGGGDVDPARYGATHRHAELAGVVAEHDEAELAAVRAALTLGLPVLAICRGLQVLNVALGGTLHQHIEHHRFVNHPVELVDGSRVAVAMGTRRPSVHSVHHQAVDRLGAGLAVTGTHADGTVEACELAGDGWVVGVQWHPEDTAADDPANQRLFDAFTAACAGR